MFGKKKQNATLNEDGMLTDPLSIMSIKADEIAIVEITKDVKGDEPVGYTIIMSNGYTFHHKHKTKDKEHSCCH